MGLRSTDSDGMTAGVGSFTAATLASRVLGYARDAALVSFFGGGAISDAFYAAFRITNLARRSAGEGAVNAAFIPVMEREKAGDQDRAVSFFSALWTAFIMAGAAVSIAGMVFAAPLVYLFSHGFTSSPEQFGLTAELTRLLFPYIFFVLLSSLCQGLLNSHRKFFLPALAPAFFSVSILIYLLALHFGVWGEMSPRVKILGAAAAASLGGLFQVALLAPEVKKLGYSFKLKTPFGDGRVKETFGMMAPALASSAGEQIAVTVKMLLATFLAAGSVTAIYNAVRITQLPLVVAVAAATVALPGLSAAAAVKDEGRFSDIFSSAGRMAGFILVPASAGLMVLSLETVRVLFEHGMFSYQQSVVTASALCLAAAGLAAYGLNRVAYMAFYAMKDWKTPLKITLVQAVADAAISLWLMRVMGLAGLALASSVSAFLGSAAYLFALRGWADRAAFISLLKGYAQFIVLAAIMAAVCWWLKTNLSGLCGRYALLGVGITAGAAVYFSLAWLAGLDELKDLAGLLRRKLS